MPSSSLASGFVRRVLAIDLRSLAALRIGTAALGLCDLATRAAYIGIHYTDDGTLLRHDVLEAYAGWHLWPACVNLIGGSLWSQILLFSLTAAALVAMGIGWRTRAATALSWLMVSSLALRNPFLVYGADNLLRLLLFWGTLVPLGALWSVDAACRDGAASGGERRRDWSGVAAVGLLLQVFAVMFIAGAAKANSPFWLAGEGLARALDHEMHTRSLGVWLSQYPSLTAVAGYAVVALEAGGCFVLFAPWWRVRMAVLLAMWAMFAGIFVTMRVGLFAPLTSVALLVFVPAEFWDALATRGVRVAALPPALRRFLDPAFWRRLLASARHASGLALTTSPPLPSGNLPRRILVEGFAAVAIVYVAVWNVGFWYDEDYTPPPGLLEFGKAFSLWQQWGTFTKLDDTGWFVIPGQLAGARQVDLLADRGPLPTLASALSHPPSFDRPALPSERFPDIHWLVLFGNMVLSPDRSAPFQYYARYLCREWNEAHSGDDRLMNLQIFYMARPIGARSRTHTSAEYEKRLLWTHNCFG